MLRKAIKAWDMKSSKDIRAVYEQFKEADNFQSDLTNALTDPSLQRGATWLLKHHLENQAVLKTSETRSIYQNLGLFTHWESKLHILQSLEYLSIPKEFKATLELFIRPCLKSKKKLLRAWGYHGFYHLNKTFPEYSKETDLLFQNAMLDESPSVIARIKNLIKSRENQA